VTKKLTYPYEYMDSPEKYLETQLPPIEKFYSSLNDEHVSPEEYQNAKEIWDTFQIKNLHEFTMLYNKLDVLLFTDIMENFRDISLKIYKLDPAWYLTTPGFSWGALLKYTRQKLELLTDYNMCLFVEQGIRGGFCQCSKRYAKVNNKYMGDKYDATKENVYIEYLDANNLYGLAMRESLPYNGFKWSKYEKLNPKSTWMDVMNVSNNSPKGYIIEVDLAYPKKLHDRHSEYPILPIKQEGSPEKVKKLMGTLNYKEHYVIHYTRLKQCLKMGLVLKKIHRVLEFNQTPWMETYIEFNTELRKKAKNSFEKDFYKLMNNAPYGKFMENVRNRQDIRLCTNAKKAMKLIAKPTFKSRTIFAENLVAFHMRKANVKFNKPIYLGMSILNNSKIICMVSTIM